MRSLNQPDSLSTNDDYLIVGKFGAAHGIQGWVKLFSYTDPGVNLFNYAPWYLRAPNNTWQTLTPLTHKTKGDAFIVQIKNCDDRDQARDLTDHAVYIHRNQLPELPQDEYYFHDLIGCQVITTQGAALGTIHRFFTTGANDVMVVKNQSQELLIPWVNDIIIKSIDLPQQTITIAWELGE